MRRSPSRPSQKACKFPVAAFVGVTFSALPAIIAGVNGSEAGSRMQWLMRVADKVNEPDEVVGLHVVGCLRGERRREGFDLRESVHRIRRARGS